MMMEPSHSNLWQSIPCYRCLPTTFLSRAYCRAVSRYFLPVGKALFRPPGRVSFLLRQKKRHQKKGRPAVTPLGGALRCSAKPAGLKLAALKQSGPLDRFFLRFSLVMGRDSKKAASYTEHDSKAHGFFVACLATLFVSITKRPLAWITPHSSPID
ncbi:MAG: hypothetical protein KZQ81_14390 [Candidatus Thiodiazotropha sp. (ex Rostrolucina anterorostrata)]|nr:hypothetical protein [Candidatus Thiodiazotropha sp. (ex Rostrolucina anterorostrata)]